uniref:Growth factor receptor domain-containing protein n=1 Tax=Neolamprologus brichardi TaxID=32507 RepID=A0A3Q4GXN4_NEOBR
RQCEPLSEVLIQFHLLSLLNSHKCKTSVTSCSYLSALLLRGIPKDLKCLPCSTGCGSCVKSIFHCLSCERPYLLLNNSCCVGDCPDGYFASMSQQECVHCPSSCLTCSGSEPTSCLTCAEGRQKDATGHCCPEGYYVKDQDERLCGRCHFSCKTCTGHHSVECVTCKPGFFKQGETCVETCSEGSATMVCERCDPSCSQCQGGGSGNCLSCRKGYVYMKQWGQCLQSCPPGYYQVSHSMSCHKCHPTCKTCNGTGSLLCLFIYSYLHCSSFLPLKADGKLSPIEPCGHRTL